MTSFLPSPYLDYLFAEPTKLENILNSLGIDTRDTKNRKEMLKHYFERPLNEQEHLVVEGGRANYTKFSDKITIYNKMKEIIQESPNKDIQLKYSNHLDQLPTYIAHNIENAELKNYFNFKKVPRLTDNDQSSELELKTISEPAINREVQRFYEALKMNQGILKYSKMMPVEKSDDNKNNHLQPHKPTRIVNEEYTIPTKNAKYNIFNVRPETMLT